MKMLAKITLLSLVLSTQAFATCRLPDGQTNDGTVGAAEMLPECASNSRDSYDATVPLAKYDAALAASAAPAAASTTTRSLIKVAQ